MLNKISCVCPNSFNEMDVDTILDNYLLPKQLLMLLRKDIGEFIIKHHKNDIFSALRAAEVAKRFAYLAGHGRQTMQRLANSSDKGTKKIAHYILPIMEKLQYMYATHYIKSKGTKQRTITEILRFEFSPKTITKNTFENEKNENGNDCPKLADIVEKIYKSKDIENEVSVKVNGSNDKTDYDTLATIKINDDI